MVNWKLYVGIGYLATALLFPEHNIGNDDCSYIQLDKNYLLSGETLKGALHTRRCQNLFPQVVIALLDSENNVLCDTWIRLESSLEPFEILVPETATNGIYQLVAYTKKNYQVLYTKELPVFSKNAETDFGHSPGPKDVVVNSFSKSEGMSVSLSRSKTPVGGVLDLVIKSESTGEEPVLFSLKVTDAAQSVIQNTEDMEKDFNAEILRSRLQAFSSHTFPVQGYLTDSSGEGCNYCRVVLTIPEEENGIYYTRTDATGAFAFTGLTHTGTKRGYLWYKTETPSPAMSFFVIVQKTPIGARSTETVFDSVKAALLPQLRRKLLVTKIANSNKATENQEVGEMTLRNYELVSIITQYDLQILFDQYHLGSDMKETIRSIVPNVNFIKRNLVRVFSNELRRNFEQAPFILLDGIPINGAQLLKIDPSAVYKIEVLHKSRTLRQVGNLGSHGVISVVTRSGSDVDEIPSVRKVYISGFDNLPKDRHRAIAKDQLAHVLYWDPVMEINRSDTLKVRIPIPTYSIQPMITISGFDSRGRFVYYHEVIALED